MKRRYFLLSLFLCPLGAQAAPSASDLMRSVAAAEKSLSYSGTAVVTRGTAPPMSIKVWRSGGKSRLEWTAPPVMNGDVLVDDDVSVWRYHRGENSAFQTRGRAEIDYARLNRTMNASLAGAGNVAGRAAWIVNLTPREAGNSPMKLWIDKQNFARLRVDRTSASGRSTSMALQSVKFGSIPASQFHWSPPAGARVTRTNGTLYNDPATARRAAGWLEIPSFVPRGYEFESAVVDPQGNGNKGEAWIRYANGINRFSIFQQRTGDNLAALSQSVKDGWFAQQGGSRFIVLGLPSTEAKQVVESLK